MLRNALRLLFVAIVVLGSAGCGESEDRPRSVDPVVAQAYRSVTDLRDAAVDAGFVCPNWDQTDRVTLASESGNCSGDNVFMVFDSDKDLQSQLALYRKHDAEHDAWNVPRGPRLVGPNWIIKWDGVAELAPKLGGTVLPEDARTPQSEALDSSGSRLPH